MAYYTPNITRTTINAASLVALEMVDDPIFILSLDDSISFLNRAAKDLFNVAENDPRKFEEIISSSQIQSPKTLMEQLRLGGKTQGRYLMEGLANQTIQVFSQEFNLQRVVRMRFQRWELSHSHEKLINKLITLPSEKLGTQASFEKLIGLLFDLLKIDVVILSLKEKGPSSEDFFRTVAHRGAILEEDLRWQLDGVGENAFKSGKCIRIEDAPWNKELGVSAFLMIPLVSDNQKVGAIHLGVIERKKLFRSEQGATPANAIDIIDAQFFMRLKKTMSQTIRSIIETPAVDRDVLRSLFSRCKEGLLLLDREGRVVFATPEAYRIAETGWERINDRRPYHVCDKDGSPLPRAKWPLFRALKEGIEFEDEALVLDFGDHQTPITFSLRIQSNFLIVTMKDLSEDLERAKVQDDFYSSIAHELRTPITPLKGLLQILIKDADGSKFDLLQRSIKQVDRLAKLISDMLEATRIDSGVFQIKRERVDVSKLIDDLRANWKFQFPYVKIHAEYDAGIVCKIDPYRFEQVICNLVENSVKYCEREPVIHIKLEGPPVSLEIRDNGVGMSDEVLSQVFDRFYQENRYSKKHGVGLGLYVAKKIIDLHEGQIEFRSERGVGTVAKVSIPSCD